MPDGRTTHYNIPVVKVQEYTKDELFDKNLLFFIPYYVLRFKKALSSKQDIESVEKEFLEDYSDIYDRLKGLEEKQTIDYNYLHDLVSLTARLVEVVSKDYPNIMREVSVMGGGKVLEMESEKIYNRGIAESVVEFLSECGEVPDALKEKIYSEKDVKVLKGWTRLSARVSSVEEFMEKM